MSEYSLTDTVESRLVSALNDILPTSPWTDVADDQDATVTSAYIVFNYTTIPVCFGDDQPAYERYMIQVHMFFPVRTNPIEKKKAVKKALLNNGFTYPSETQVSNDKYGQHYCLECQTITEACTGE